MVEARKLHLKRVFHADRSRVFEAWVKPDLMVQWLAPGDMSVASVSCEAEVGGSYRIEMGRVESSAQRQNTAVAGTYRKIVSGNLRCLTWGWPGDLTPETLLEVEFRDVGNGTEASLTQTGFVEQEACDEHRAG
jgi:uncharacterized protein YndB with AHSA1/START domain